MTERDRKIDAAIKVVEEQSKEQKLGGDSITVEMATEALNAAYGTEYTTSYTPIHQAIQRGVLPATKLMNTIWLIGLDDFMLYLDKFRPRRD